MVALQHFYKDFAIVLHDITMELHKLSTFPLNPSASFNLLFCLIKYFLSLLFRGSDELEKIRLLALEMTTIHKNIETEQNIKTDCLIEIRVLFYFYTRFLKISAPQGPKLMNA